MQEGYRNRSHQDLHLERLTAAGGEHEPGCFEPRLLRSRLRPDRLRVPAGRALHALRGRPDLLHQWDFQRQGVSRHRRRHSRHRRIAWVQAPRRQNAHPEAWKEPICDRPLRCGSKRASGASSGEATAAPRALLCEEIRNPEPLVPCQPRMDRIAPARLFSRMDRLPSFGARRERTGAAASQAARIPLDRLRLGAVTIDPRPSPAARGGDANSGRPTRGPAGS
jgi:hypothetical protein